MSLFVPVAALVSSFPLYRPRRMNCDEITWTPDWFQLYPLVTHLDADITYGLQGGSYPGTLTWHEP